MSHFLLEKVLEAFSTGLELSYNLVKCRVKSLQGWEYSTWIFLHEIFKNQNMRMNWNASFKIPVRIPHTPLSRWSWCRRRKISEEISWNKENENLFSSFHRISNSVLLCFSSFLVHLNWMTGTMEWIFYIIKWNAIERKSMEITYFVYISKFPSIREAWISLVTTWHYYNRLLFPFSCFIEIYIHLIDDRESSERKKYRSTGGEIEWQRLRSSSMLPFIVIVHNLCWMKWKHLNVNN